VQEDSWADPVLEGAAMPTQPSRELEVFPNPNPERPYEIFMECAEFTCLCPKTGQPDFATLRIRFIPARLCVELKSLKLYLWSFRNEGAFHEAVTNRICDDLVRAIDPQWIEVEGDFLIRGGIHTVITARHGKRPA
jgi:7-cyano-7-deazaguanine reductase